MTAADGACTPIPPSSSTPTSQPHLSSTPAKSALARTHICATCARAFTTAGHLARHARTHTGEKNHVCPFPGCATRCSRQDNLHQHYRIHLSPGSRRKPGRRNLSIPIKRSPSPSITLSPTDAEPSLTLVPASPTSAPNTPPPLHDSRAFYLHDVRIKQEDDDDESTVLRPYQFENTEGEPMSCIAPADEVEPGVLVVEYAHDADYDSANDPFGYGAERLLAGIIKPPPLLVDAYPNIPRVQLRRCAPGAVPLPLPPALQSRPPTVAPEGTGLLSSGPLQLQTSSSLTPSPPNPLARPRRRTPLPIDVPSRSPSPPPPPPSPGLFVSHPLIVRRPLSPARPGSPFVAFPVRLRPAPMPLPAPPVFTPTPPTPRGTGRVILPTYLPTVGQQRMDVGPQWRCGSVLPLLDTGYDFRGQLSASTEAGSGSGSGFGSPCSLEAGSSPTHYAASAQSSPGAEYHHPDYVHPEQPPAPSQSRTLITTTPYAYYTYSPPSTTASSTSASTASSAFSRQSQATSSTTAHYRNPIRGRARASSHSPRSAGGATRRVNGMHQAGAGAGGVYPHPYTRARRSVGSLANALGDASGQGRPREHQYQHDDQQQQQKQGREQPGAIFAHNPPRYEPQVYDRSADPLEQEPAPAPAPVFVHSQGQGQAMSVYGPQPTPVYVPTPVHAPAPYRPLAYAYDSPELEAEPEPEPQSEFHVQDVYTEQASAYPDHEHIVASAGYVEQQQQQQQQQPEYAYAPAPDYAQQRRQQTMYYADAEPEPVYEERPLAVAIDMRLAPQQPQHYPPFSVPEAEAREGHNATGPPAYVYYAPSDAAPTPAHAYSQPVQYPVHRIHPQNPPTHAHAPYPPREAYYPPNYHLLAR
ncbi:Nrg1-like zn-finger transcription factor [Mycena kentingensis (nom. inval.)]|nr:Nrg1-like zn-finger transcription factor [Mycena kentingensis (nom. inval.)]